MRYLRLTSTQFDFGWDIAGFLLGEEREGRERQRGR